MKLLVSTLILFLNISIASTKYIEDDQLRNQLKDLMRDVEEVKNSFDFFGKPSQKPMQSSMKPSQKPMQPSMKPSQKPMQPSMKPSQKQMQPSMKPSQKPIQPSMKPSQKPIQPSYTPSMPLPGKPGPEKINIRKFMIMSLMKKVGNLLLTLRTVKGMEKKFHKMEIPSSKQENKEIMRPSGLVKIAINQLNQVFWEMHALGRMMKNKRGPNPTTSGPNDEKKQGIIEMTGQLFQLLKKASEGKMDGEDVNKMKEAVEKVEEQAPKLLKKLKDFKEILEFVELHHNETNGPDRMKPERPQIISLVKLTSMKMEKMFWTMTMISKMKKVFKEKMMSGDNNNEKEMMMMKMMLKMKVGFMKMAVMRLADTFWAVKKLKRMIEGKYEERVGPVGTEPPQNMNIPDEALFEQAKDRMWMMHKMLQKCAKAMEEINELPMIDGHVMWEGLPIKKMIILQKMNEMIKAAPKVSKQIGIFKKKLEDIEEEYGEEDHEDKREWGF